MEDDVSHLGVQRIGWRVRHKLLHGGQQPARVSNHLRERVNRVRPHDTDPGLVKPQSMHTIVAGSPNVDALRWRSGGC